MTRKTYDYLFKLTFVRSGDYFNMYLRLLVLGSLFIVFVPNELLQIAFALLFIYMSIFQMITLFYHHETNMWLDLYPVPEEVKEKSYLSFSAQLSFLQIIIYVLLFLLLGRFTAALIFIVGALLFHFLFHQFYVQEKIRR